MNDKTQLGHNAQLDPFFKSQFGTMVFKRLYGISLQNCRNTQILQINKHGSKYIGSTKLNFSDC